MRNLYKVLILLGLHTPLHATPVEDTHPLNDMHSDFTPQIDLEVPELTEIVCADVMYTIEDLENRLLLINEDELDLNKLTVDETQSLYAVKKHLNVVRFNKHQFETYECNQITRSENVSRDTCAPEHADWNVCLTDHYLDFQRYTTADLNTVFDDLGHIYPIIEKARR